MMDKVTFWDVELALKQFTWAYGKRMIDITEDMVEFWYEQFKDCDREPFLKAIKYIVNVYTEPPTLADVYAEWKRYKISDLRHGNS